MPEMNRPLESEVDVAIIGAGILGAGVAQAAAAAGHRVRLFERTAPAVGTSSRSSKLIHGGLRYLETGQFRLVREALREREWLLKNAPGLVHPLRFFVPIYRDTRRRPAALALGLLLYRLLGGGPGSGRISPRHWHNPDGLDTRNLQAVFTYLDAQTDDAALTRAVLRSAQALGAELHCPAEVESIEKRPDGYSVISTCGGQRRETHCATLVNTAGPWVNRVLDRITAPALELNLELPVDLVQGAHLVLAGRLAAGAYYVEAADRRAVFILPWQAGTTLVGTTETPFHGDPDTVHPLPEEIAYLLDTVKRHFPRRSLSLQSTFAGLRVLPRGTGSAFGRARETLFATDAGRPPRLVSVCGGKLTTWRVTAEKVLHLLAPALPARSRRVDTHYLRLEPI